MEEKERSYAGIGSRETPKPILDKMTEIAKQLSADGYWLHSGGADGADSAFEEGATQKRIFLPWRGFNSSPSEHYQIPKEAFVIAEQFHPAWANCSPGAQKLHARNCQQILGKDLKHPVDFVLCWHKNKGGTMQAVRIAIHYNIPVVNLADIGWEEKLNTLLKEKEV